MRLDKNRLPWISNRIDGDDDKRADHIYDYTVLEAISTQHERLEGQFLVVTYIRLKFYALLTGIFIVCMISPGIHNWGEKNVHVEDSKPQNFYLSSSELEAV
ncbi:hypothetical protein SDJN02_10506, partial [Cucurbita argyrosperma subsp. argyrosperma]